MEKSSNREMRISRMFKAPIDLVWDMWTQPEHLVAWWGPNGFTSTVLEFDFVEGGEWRLTMHGPDGTDYANRSVFKEIVRFKRIVFEHFNPHFITTVLFDAKGDETLIDWRMEFDTAEMRQIVITAHKADEGMKQNVEKLESYITERVARQQ